MVKKYVSKAREKTKKFKKEFRKQATIATLAAFAFLIALTWRDFISNTVDKIVTSLGVSDQLYLYKLLSAILVTLIAILGIMLVSKFKIEENIK